VIVIYLEAYFRGGKSVRKQNQPSGKKEARRRGKEKAWV
jgi:hypothetical protein